MFGKSIHKMSVVAAVSLIVVSSAVAMERAASIEYETVERPANLQADFIAPSDASLKFLAIKAIDGSRVDAVISQPNSKTAASSTAVVSVHGSGGSYDSDPNGFLVRLLASKGYAVLAINTRQSGARVNTENFLDVRRDIEAGRLHGSRIGLPHDRSARPQPRQHSSSVLRREQLGCGYQRCGVDRNVRQSPVEVTSHVGAKRGELCSAA